MSNLLMGNSVKRIDFRRVFVITSLTALIVIYAVLWLRMISSRAERTGADFIVFTLPVILPK